MPRKARVKSSTHIYHVVIRGADRQHIFIENKDYLKYLDILKYYKEKLTFDLFSYCLMSNHIHLLIHTPETPLETVFRHINTRYAVWFNMKYERTGFLQQGRYYSEPVEDFRYLLTVVRYIHQNPYHAGLEKSPGDPYLWNSMPIYLNETPSFLNTAYILNVFGGREKFISFHKESGKEECLDTHQFKKRLPDDVAQEIIFQETGCSTPSQFQMLSLSQKEKHLSNLHEKGISIRQLNRLTGISKGIIERSVTKGHSL